MIGTTEFDNKIDAVKHELYNGILYLNWEKIQSAYKNINEVLNGMQSEICILRTKLDELKEQQ